MRNNQAIADHITHDRLRSYLSATAADLEAAIALYDWNIRVGSALLEDLSRLEVVFRNTIDSALVAHGQTRQWRSVWYRRPQLFPGKPGARALDDIATARRRAKRRGQPEAHGKVIAELSFGFWRFLCTPNYLTSLWVPALAALFPAHPNAGDPRQVRADVEDRIQRLHFLRNRIAHHEPIDQRNLAIDHRALLEVLQWISADSHDWAAATTRTPTAIAERT